MNGANETALTPPAGPGHITALWFTPGERAVVLDAPRPPGGAGFLWLDIERAQTNWAELAQPWFSVPFDEQHVQDGLNDTHPPYYDGTDGYDMLIVRAVDVGSPVEEPTTRPVALFLLPGGIVSVRPSGDPVFAGLRERWLRGTRLQPRRPEELLHQMLDRVIDGLLERWEPISELLSRWQGQMLDHDRPFTDWKALMLLRSRLRRLEAYSEAQLDSLTALREFAGIEMDPALNVRYNDLMEHQKRVLQHTVVIQTDIDALVQVYFSFNTERTNRILQLLAVVSVIFLPLNLIAGIFGMNFEALPLIHQGNGTWFAFGAMGTLASGLLLWFRLRRWI